MIFWLLLIIVALCVGIYLGYMWRRSHEPNTPVKFHRDYLAGLNFLLNEQPDKAVDIFIKMLKVDKDTVETHISLGNLFRRKGEINRALKIHQNLLDGGELNKEQRIHAMAELGYDYLSAGVFDRAESTFREVIRLDEKQVGVLKALLDIYEKEKDWQSAIPVAKKLELATGDPMHHVIAQFYCELAALAYEKKQINDAMDALKQALRFDKKCVRASLLKGRYELDQQDNKQALKTLSRIKQQDPRFLSEAIEDIVVCHEKSTKAPALETYLTELIDEFPQIPFVLILSERLKVWRGEKAAENFVAQYVRNHPSFSGLKLLIDLHIAQIDGKAKEDLLILYGLIERLLKIKPKYRCQQCGFSGRVLHWQCIGCKRWGTMLPLHGELF